jgi:hypothetical protein
MRRWPMRRWPMRRWPMRCSGLGDGLAGGGYDLLGEDA